MDDLWGGGTKNPDDRDKKLNVKITSKVHLAPSTDQSNDKNSDKPNQIHQIEA